MNVIETADVHSAVVNKNFKDVLNYLSSKCVTKTVTRLIMRITVLKHCSLLLNGENRSLPTWMEIAYGKNNAGEHILQNTFFLNSVFKAFSTNLSQWCRHCHGTARASVYLAPARRSCYFGSTRYGLVYATRRQWVYSPVKKHTARRCSLHCHTCKLLMLCAARAGVSLHNFVERC
jgi:hypothetical protein